MELEAVYSAAPSAEVYNECIRSLISLYGTCVQVSLRQFFFNQNTSVFPCHYLPPVLYTHSLVCHRCHIVLTMDIVITQSTEKNAWGLYLLCPVASVI